MSHDEEDEKKIESSEGPSEVTVSAGVGKVSKEERLKTLEDLKLFVSLLPKEPGVYLMKNIADVVIYVGKAKNLRNRVRSYFQNSKDLPVKVKHLVSHIVKIDFIVTQTEVEAFLLEASLIKKNRPRYNIRLKDDKSYPYIKCTTGEDYPRLYLVRKVKKDRAFYYGPYASSFAVRKTMQFLNQTFNIRDCSNGFMQTRKRPCLTYDMGRCQAPCVDYVSKDDYRKNIDKAIDFLEGDNKVVLKSLNAEMLHYAENESFEVAAKIRDQIRSIDAILEKQAMVSDDRIDTDLVAYFSNEHGALVEIVSVRKGRVIGSRPYFFNKNNLGAEYEDQRHWVISFLNHYYDDNLIPDRIILPIAVGVELEKLFKDVLKSRTHRTVSVSHIAIKHEKNLQLLAEKNAHLHFDQFAKKSAQRDEGLKLIQEKLKLPDLPRRIECYDISNFQGQQSVASQVVFYDGSPSKEDYRKYKIKTVQGANDFESMKEVLKRRFSHKEYPDPQMILVDGGKGQLKLALEALKEVGREDIPIRSLAKARTDSDFENVEVKGTDERFFIPGRQNPVIFRNNTEAFRILVQLRDEAHRFAIEFHRKLRDQESFSSVLDQIPGLGPKKRETLDRFFPDMTQLMAASQAQLERLPGFPKALAKRIYEALHP